MIPWSGNARAGRSDRSPLSAYRSRARTSVEAHPVLFVFGDQDLNIPVALHRFLAERAASRDTRGIAGASHALSVSKPDAVATTILDAVDAASP